MDKLNSRIAVSNTTSFPDEMVLYKDGKQHWNPDFRERLLDYMKLFNDLFSSKLNEEIDLNGWGVRFIQFDLLMPSFHCDVYLNNPSHFHLFKSIIEEQSPKDIKIDDFVFKGDEADYFATLPK